VAMNVRTTPPPAPSPPRTPPALVHPTCTMASGASALLRQRCAAVATSAPAPRSCLTTCCLLCSHARLLRGSGTGLATTRSSTPNSRHSSSSFARLASNVAAAAAVQPPARAGGQDAAAAAAAAPQHARQPHQQVQEQLHSGSGAHAQPTAAYGQVSGPTLCCVGIWRSQRARSCLPHSRPRHMQCHAFCTSIAWECLTCPARIAARHR
jgi:hypothetical protein